MKISIPIKQTGQSLVETALVIPLIFLLIFSFIDLGRAIYFYSALGNSVREGARFASVTKLESQTDYDAVEAKVIDYAVALDITSGNINVVLNGNDTVTVSAIYTFVPVTPFLGRVFGPGNYITLKSDSTMLLAPIAR
jgi:Flp pilus assembly protein TadG